MKDRKREKKRRGRPARIAIRLLPAVLIALTAALVFSLRQAPVHTSADGAPEDTPDATAAPEETPDATAAAPGDVPAVNEISAAAGELIVEFIDVGQADCTLIYSHDGAALIDGGNTADGQLVVDYLYSIGVHHLDYVIATHAHEDHYGGLRQVLSDLTVDNVMLPLAGNDNIGYRKLVRQSGDSNAAVMYPEVGERFGFGSAAFEVLCCEPAEDPEDMNEWSIVLRMDFGDTSWIFAADSQTANEREMLFSGIDLDVDVLKVGHHGSYTSSSMDFLNAVTPDICVISCGAGNDFEHPHDVTMKRLGATGAEIYRTDESGTIRIRTEGTAYAVTSFHTDTDAPPP